MKCTSLSIYTGDLLSQALHVVHTKGRFEYLNIFVCLCCEFCLDEGDQTYRIVHRLIFLFHPRLTAHFHFQSYTHRAWHLHHSSFPPQHPLPPFDALPAFLLLKLILISWYGHRCRSCPLSSPIALSVHLKTLMVFHFCLSAFPGRPVLRSWRDSKDLHQLCHIPLCLPRAFTHLHHQPVHSHSIASKIAYKWVWVMF